MILQYVHANSRSIWAALATIDAAASEPRQSLDYVYQAGAEVILNVVV